MLVELTLGRSANESNSDSVQSIIAYFGIDDLAELVRLENYY